MNPSPQTVRAMAEAKEESHYRFRSYLKMQDHLSPEAVDELVFETTKRVWAKIDCTQCANCCKEVGPVLHEKDIPTFAEYLKLSPEEFTRQYLEDYEPEDGNARWVPRQMPCPMLKDNLCQIYDRRPQSCQDYPHLYKPDFIFRTLGMIGRASTCPIVYQVLENLRAEFRRRDQEASEDMG